MIEIAIISTNAIGDTYLSLSAIKPLKEYFGNTCSIHLFALDECQKLVDLTGVDKFSPLKDKKYNSCRSITEGNEGKTI